MTFPNQDQLPTPKDYAKIQPLRAYYRFIDHENVRIYDLPAKCMGGVLHQFWTGPKPIPKVFADWCHKWQSLNPTWKYLMWNEDLVRQHDPELGELITKASCPAVASDIARVAAVHKFGGVYVDCDFEPQRSITNLFKDVPAFYVNLDEHGDAASAIFGAYPYHPWMKEMRRLLLEDQLSHQAYPPWNVHLMRAIAVKYGVQQVPHGYFYPYPYRRRQCHVFPARAWPLAYAVHRHAMSWAPEGSLMEEFYKTGEDNVDTEDNPPDTVTASLDGQQERLGEVCLDAGDLERETSRLGISSLDEYGRIGG